MDRTNETVPVSIRKITDELRAKVRGPHSSETKARAVDEGFFLEPQAVLLSMNDDLAAYALEVKTRFDAAGLRAEVDTRTESLNRKVREAQLSQIPLTLTIGPKEKENGTLAVRTLDGKVAYGVPQARFADAVGENVRRRALNFDGFGAEDRN